MHDTADEDFALVFGFGSAVYGYLHHFLGKKEICSSMPDGIVTIAGKNGFGEGLEVDRIVQRKA